MVRDTNRLTRADLLRRFGLPVIGFVVVAAFLTQTLLGIARETRLDKAIRTVLTEVLTHLPASRIVETIHRERDQKLYVLAHLSTSRHLSPTQVGRIQQSLSEKMAQPVELIVRTTAARDVSAPGSYSQVAAQDLDGFFVSKKADPRLLNVKIADTIMRDYLADRSVYELFDVTMLKMETGTVLLARMSGFLPIPPKMILKDQGPEIRKEVQKILEHSMM
jgi:hypothetical protein